MGMEITEVFLLVFLKEDKKTDTDKILLNKSSSSLFKSLNKKRWESRNDLLIILMSMLAIGFSSGRIAEVEK